jgi:hypothetical protein
LLMCLYVSDFRAAKEKQRAKESTKKTTKPTTVKQPKPKLQKPTGAKMRVGGKR